jgi:NTE family protein
VAPDWIAGDSIGAINAALIAGNAPERRVERLSAFWEGVSANMLFMPPPCMEPMRAMLNAFSATSSVTFGVPGFFLHASRLPSKRRLTRSGTWQRHEGESAHRRER